MLKAVVTTIAEPTDCMRELARRLEAHDVELVVIGDRRGPDSFDLDGAAFMPLGAQLDMPFRLAKLLPVDHYARKNLGYLKAVSERADCIYETDDDNAPKSRWTPRNRSVRGRSYSSEGWVNAYRLFTDELIWPRGFPLGHIRANGSSRKLCDLTVDVVDAPIQQGLVDVAPDVDALWRMLFDKPVHFSGHESVCLGPGSWCPFNSQSTWWWSDAFPLMYLPSSCSVRTTDIWRGFIAQRCLWETGRGVVFHTSEVDQHRNAHSLMSDFEAEVAGYLGNERFASTLMDTELLTGTENTALNLVRCYEALIEAEFFPAAELELVKNWVADLEDASASCR